ncbi:hypothetical protein LSM04_006415 [Trypanosoma melophagium]|uniref:uncharacterized protein n=1 Tax=Trypanosoma melophagium TaxID=715481 RepID=UPI00351A4771|nr:hypothetical protein LSM04_006415 [Trypanosoma melophagium]
MSLLHAAVAPSFPASGVTHSVVGIFSSSLPDGVKEVAVLKMNVLELWRVPHNVEKGDSHMTYVTSIVLNAPPVSVVTCRPPGFTVDIIAMCFDDFHVSFVQYDALLMRLHTLALVQLDDRELMDDAKQLDPLMRVDPTGRFVAVLARRRHMFLIPLLGIRRAEDENNANNNNNNNNNNNEIQVDNKDNNNIKETVAPVDDWGDEDDYKELSEHGDSDVPRTDKKTENDVFVESNNSKSFPALDGLLLRIGLISMFTLATAVKSSIHYVRDMYFIESAGEPIVAVLCERQPTWAGRVKLVEWRTKMVESNTLSLQVVWVQISAASTTAPKLLLIGEVDDIPCNVTHMTPVSSFAQVPSGVVCYGINTVMHITTKRGYGAYINNNGMEECVNSKSSAVMFGKVMWRDTQFELSTALFKVNLSLANCAAASMSADNEGLYVLAVSEEDGVVLTLFFAAQGSAVQSVKIDIIGVGCYSSTVSFINPRTTFLGSARGDSCVAVVNTFQSNAESRFQVVHNMEAIGCIMDMDVVDCTPDSEKNDHAGNGRDLSWFINMPYVELLQNTTLEPMPHISLEEARIKMDLAVCAGYGASGSIYVMRQSIRNNIVRRENVNAVSAFFLPSTQNVKRPREHEEDEHATCASSYAPPHLLITGIPFTILFAVRGNSVQHVRRSEFLASCRTVFATDLPWLKALLQVTEREGRIISPDGRVLFQKFYFVPEREAEKQRYAKAACVEVELQLLFVLLEDGTLLQFALKATNPSLKKEIFSDKVTAFTLWREKKRIVAFDTEGKMTITDIESRTSHAVFPQLGVLPPHCIFHASVSDAGTAENSSKGKENTEPVIPVTHVEIVTLDNDTSSSTSDNASTDHARGKELTSLLVILATGELAVYQMFSPDDVGPLRLIKYIHHFLDNKAEREVIESIEMKKQRLLQERANIENFTQSMRHCSRRIVSFHALGGNNGVYVCGQHPLFLFWDRRMRRLVPYLHQTPGPVRGFVPFPSIESGFILCSEGFVDFASMQNDFQPNRSGWLTRRIHIGATPHFIVYHPPAHSCFVVTSRKEPFRPQKAPFDVHLKINYDEEYGNIQSVTTEVPVCNLPPISPDAGVRVPMANRFEIRFMSTSDWACTDTLLLEENEQVLGAQMMEILTEKGTDGPATAPVCVVSTAFPLGEDVTCRGRILLLSSKWGKTGRKILLLHSEPLNGPATTVTGICNHIAVAVGGTIKLFRYDWETRKLVVSALLYAGIYVTRMSAFRNYLIYGDLYRSCALARFNEENHTLNVLGKDQNTVSVVHCDMMYHDRALGILCSDDQRNVLIMGYTPRLQESEAGKPKKVLESVLSLDGGYRLPSGCLAKSLRFRSLAGNSSVTLYATNYGEIGFIVPLGEQASRTALWVTRRLQTDLPHEAGLTPRMFLGLSQGSPQRALRSKEMLVSASLLEQFFFLDVRSRKAIATAAYTQLERVTNVAALVYEECNLF